MNISKRKQGILAIICTIAMIVTSITVYNPREVKADQSAAASYDYSSAEWIGDGAGGGKYSNKYKLVKIKGVENIVNIQKPGFATVDGIYMGLASSDVKKVTVNGTETSEYDMQGAGMLLHLAAMTEKYNDILIYNSNGEAFAELYGYYADGTDSGTVEPVEKPAAPANLNVSFNEEEKTCTISFDEVEGITTYNFYVGSTKIGTVPENKTFKISDLNVEEGKEYTFGVTSVNAENVESNKATAKATIPVFGAPSAPTQIYANINPAQTDYTVGVVQAVTGAKGYNFYINGKFAKEIAKDQVITIEEMEKYGLKRGEVNKFGISAFNSKGESAITTIDVPVPGTTEETTIEDGKEILKNVEFSDGNSWGMDYCHLDNVTYMGAGKINFGVKAYDSGNRHDSQLTQEGIKLASNKWYVATVTVKSSVARKIQLVVQENGGSWKEESNPIFKTKANEDTTFTTTFKVETAANEYLFGLMLGYVDNTKSDAAEITVSNVSLKGYTNKPTKNVTIDSTVKGKVAPGDTYTLPIEAKYGYYDTVNKVIYKAGSEITVNDDVNLVSITDVSVKMYNGAAIRIKANEETPGGIRFKASVDVTCGVAEYKNEITNKVQAGTLITTKDILDAKNDVEYNVENVNNIGKVLDVKNTGWLDESTHSYSASLIKIVKANYNRYFVAKAYVEVPYDNAASEYVYSADGDSYANSVERSISDVAKAIKGNDEYDGITDKAIKSLIDSFIVTK